jgi:hypothetical protein
MDLFSRTCLDLGSSFILIKGIDWIISSTGWFLRIIFAAFFITDWFQKFVKDSKRKMEVLR